MVFSVSSGDGIEKREARTKEDEKKREKRYDGRRRGMMGEEEI